MSTIQMNYIAWLHKKNKNKITNKKKETNQAHHFSKTFKGESETSVVEQ